MTLPAASGSMSISQLPTLEGGFRSQTAAAGTRDKDADWAASQVFLHKGPSATLEFLEPAIRAQLYAYQAQARDGSFPKDEDLAIISDHTLRRKQEAWRALDGMTKEVAKQELVDLLDRVYPAWRTWYAENFSVVCGTHQSGEAQRLLEAFAERQARSKL